MDRLANGPCVVWLFVAKWEHESKGNILKKKGK